MYRYIIILLFSLFCISTSHGHYKTAAHLDTANTYVGTVEATGHNDGVNVEKFLRSVGLEKGYSWCAAFVSYCLTVSHSTFPIRSALAQKFITKQSIKANDVLIGKIKIPSGSLVIWKRGTGPLGHIGFIRRWGTVSGETIEGNTSSNEVGSQFEGGGVFQKTRTIQPSNYFRICYFTLVN